MAYYILINEKIIFAVKIMTTLELGKVQINTRKLKFSLYLIIYIILRNVRVICNRIPSF